MTVAAGMEVEAGTDAVVEAQASTQLPHTTSLRCPCRF